MNEDKRRAKSGLVLGIAVLLVVCSLGVIASPARAAIIPQWTSAPDMGDSRAQAVVVNDENGLVYVMGGVNTMSGGGYRDVPYASSYNPYTGVWTDLAPMITGVRGAAGAFGQDGRVYVIGGWNESAGGPIDTTQIYDPASNTWSTGAAIPLGSWEAKAVAIQEDTIVVAGGEDAVGAVYLYDIGDDAWSTGATMPVAMLAGVFVTDGYYSYYIGGVDSSYTAQSSVFVYYYWDSWGSRADLPVTIAAEAAALGADGFIYVFGGGASDSNVEPGSALGWCTNPDDWVWQDLPDLQVAAKYLGAAATPDGRILAVGGNDDTSVMSKVESMTVMTVNVTLGQTVVGPGDSILVTVAMDFAFAVPQGYDVYPYLMDSNGVIYGLKEVSTWLPNSFAFEVSVPSAALPGSYTVVLWNLYSWYDSGSSEPMQLSYAVTVTDTYTIDEQLTMLAMNVTVLQYQIGLLGMAMAEANAALSENLTAINAQMDYLFGQLAILQAALTQIGTGLQTMGAAQAAAMAELNVTLTDLQTQLDHFQEQIDRVENKADTAGTYGMVTMVLVILIIVLLVVMLMMARKKP